jgi:hypothetical protein
MSVFADFERAVLAALLQPHLAPAAVRNVLDDAEWVSYEHTEVGYFLTVRHPGLPIERLVCDKPLLVGTCDDIECGFVVFVQDGELMLECHSWSGTAIPKDLRHRPVRIDAGDAPA